MASGSPVEVHVHHRALARKSASILFAPTRTRPVLAWVACSAACTRAASCCAFQAATRGRDEMRTDCPPGPSTPDAGRQADAHHDELAQLRAATSHDTETTSRTAPNLLG